MKAGELLKIHAECYEQSISKRYVSPEFIEAFIKKLPHVFTTKKLGLSVEKRPIFSVQFGTGKTKILMWSQMHGNESTTTKVLCDFCNLLSSKNGSSEVRNLLNNFTFILIPMLNPDGAKKWTRNNANNIDLNRDAIKKSQPESLILRATFDQFKPDICFNLHGQRTIFGFEKTHTPSMISFLAPSANEERSFTLSRKRSAHIISKMYKCLITDLPNAIGLYDDAYNPNCIGDAFQKEGVATVLFEAGHFPNDYSRERTRKYVFAALIVAIEASLDQNELDVTTYQSIPEHSKCYCDLHLMDTGKITSYHYEEVLINDQINLIPRKLATDLGTGAIAHREVYKLETLKV